MPPQRAIPFFFLFASSAASPPPVETVRNDKVTVSRAYDIRIRAGTRERQYTHHDRVVVRLPGATLKHLMPDGREESSTLKTGESVWPRGGTHIGQNLGSTDLWAVVKEPK